MLSSSEIFELEYDRIVNKNKNIFYFKYYCSDIQEFKDWIHHNIIHPNDFQELKEEYKETYVVFCINKLVKSFKKDLMKFNKDIESYNIKDMVKIFEDFNINYTNYINEYQANTYSHLFDNHYI